MFLPEASDYIASSTAESLSLVSTEDNKRFVEAVARMSRVYNIAINIGIHEPTAVEKTLRNTSLWLQDGQIKQRYRKLHLFDVDIKDGPVLKESENVEKGQEIVPPFDTLVGKVGLTICFDLRFPETGLALRRQGAQILTYPSAFTVPTGQAHWEVLLRARAIETQSYVVAAAQIGKHNEKRVSYGHSMIIDPWGKIVAHIEEEDEYPRVAFADVDLGLVEKVRREVPLLRRTLVLYKHGFWYRANCSQRHIPRDLNSRLRLLSPSPNRYIVRSVTVTFNLWHV